MKAGKILALLLALALCAGLLPAAAENADDEFPVRFDLREYGVVTPVKTQNPWSTCWAFGGIAAAETSILTSLGMSCEEYKEAQGEEFDLSERHLAWFALHAISEQTSKSQAGEGLYLRGQEEDPTLVYSIGGANLYTTTLFSTGVGPVAEELFPYHGAEGLTAVQYIAKYPDKVAAAAVGLVESQLGLGKMGMTLEQLFDQRKEKADLFEKLLNALQKTKMLDESLTVDTVTYDDLVQACVNLANASAYMEAAKGNNYYSPSDDWTIPETDENGRSNRDVYSGFTLVDGNILPELTVKEDGKWVRINEAGMRAVKSELLKGHGVTVSFLADTARPGIRSRKTAISIPIPGPITHLTTRRPTIRSALSAGTTTIQRTTSGKDTSRRLTVPGL